MILRALNSEEVPALRALQCSLAPAHRAWSDAAARDELLDPGRAGGMNVALACEGQGLFGFVGWVSFAALATGEFYGAPFVAANDEAARLLLGKVLAEAAQHRAKWVRVSAFQEEGPKTRALSNAGFRPVFEFIDLALDLSRAAPGPSAIEALLPVDLTHVDGERFADLSNACFRGVANAPGITAPMAEELWRQESVARDGSQLWADDRGLYQAFLLLKTDGTVDSLGVRPGGRRRGTARRMLERAVAAATLAGWVRLRCVIASDNGPSLALHRACGFADFERRTVWQRDVAGEPAEAPPAGPNRCSGPGSST